MQRRRPAAWSNWWLNETQLLSTGALLGLTKGGLQELRGDEGGVLGSNLTCLCTTGRAPHLAKTVMVA